MYDTVGPAQANGFAALLAAILDYTGVLENIGAGNMGTAMNAAISSALSLVVINMTVKQKKATGTISHISPLTGAAYSGIFAMLLTRIMGNNIQNANLLGALGAFAGTYLAAEHDDKSS